MSSDINRFSLVKQEGKISPSLSVQKWILEAGTDGRVELDDLKNIMTIFNRSPRGSLFRENQGTETRWSALVPLTLAAFKEYRDINYSEWAWNDPAMLHLLDTDFKALVPYITGELPVEEFDVASRLDMLKEAATVRSGKSAGIVKSPTALTSITKVDRLSQYPRLLKVMILQTWVAHPTLRTKYMILDCKDLDSMPPAMVDIDILKPTVPWI
jgi:hypothetical protein